MSEGISRVDRGIRPVDWVLAGALTALGVWLMVENALIEDARVTPAIADGTMIHEMTSHSWAMVPVFALATVPVLWWRRNVITVTSIAVVVMVLHDLLFGWVTRCGAGLPLAFVLAYLGYGWGGKFTMLIGAGIGAWLTYAFYGPLVRLWQAALVLGLVFGTLAVLVCIFRAFWNML